MVEREDGREGEVKRDKEKGSRGEVGGSSIVSNFTVLLPTAS